MPDRVFQALDMLANEAGNAIEEARQFQVEQQRRMQALAIKAQEFQQEQEKINIQKDQADTAKELAHSTIEDRKRKAVLEEKQRKEKLFADDLDFLMKAEERHAEQFKSGITDPDDSLLRLAYKKLGIEYPGEPKFGGIPPTKHVTISSGSTGRYINAKERVFSDIVNKFDPNKTLDENYNDLSPKEKEVFDKGFRATSMQELLQMMLMGQGGGFQFPTEE